MGKELEKEGGTRGIRGTHQSEVRCGYFARRVHGQRRRKYRQKKPRGGSARRVELAPALKPRGSERRLRFEKEPRRELGERRIFPRHCRANTSSQPHLFAYRAAQAVPCSGRLITQACRVSWPVRLVKRPGGFRMRGVDILPNMASAVGPSRAARVDRDSARRGRRGSAGPCALSVQPAGRRASAPLRSGRRRPPPAPLLT